MNARQQEVRENIKALRESLPGSVRLVAVSKFNPPELIEAAYAEGQRLFGESHAQELSAKAAQLPGDIEWHFIGHLQTNKVKQVVPLAACIESVDSARLLREIDRRAAAIGKVMPCLLQFHIAREETKFGFSYAECEELLRSEEFASMRNVSIAGVMGMASITDDSEQILSEFASLRDIFDRLKSEFFASSPAFKEISMGMTHDYPFAIRQGATLIRVGTLIFGERSY